MFTFSKFMPELVQFSPSVLGEKNRRKILYIQILFAAVRNQNNLFWVVGEFVRVFTFN